MWKFSYSFVCLFALISSEIRQPYLSISTPQYLQKGTDQLNVII